MTRLETNGEPSMEEILASIRRIIAEEPPGSRAAAPAPRAAQHSTATGSAAAATIDRSLFARDTAPAKVDPQLRPDALSTAPADSNHSNYSPVSFPASAETKTDRRDAAPTFRDAFSSSKLSAAADSVQAQLSDLLDDSDGVAAVVKPVKTDAGSASPNAPSDMRPSESQPRFTVSRDGYVPAAASVNEADPFDFDLGPSPFSKREKASAPGADTTAKTALRDDAFDDVIAGLDAVKPAMNSQPASPLVAEPSPVFSARYADPENAEPAKPAAVALATPKPAAIALEPEKPAAMSVETAKRETADDRSGSLKPGLEKTQAAVPPADKPKPASAIEQKTVAPIASPSIAATLPPATEASFSSKVNSAGFAKSVETMSRRSTQDSLQDVVTEAVSAALTRPSKYSAVEMGDKPVAVEVDEALTPGQQIAVRGASDSRGASNSGGGNLPAVRDGETGIRTMEDTVADLLRPMLKSWLAENMPKIIERALRREISEMTMSGQHKTAAE